MNVTLLLHDAHRRAGPRSEDRHPGALLYGKMLDYRDPVAGQALKMRAEHFRHSLEEHPELVAVV